MTFILNQYLKSFVGFDDIFNEINKTSLNNNSSNVAFDIIRFDNNKYQINIALAGVTFDQISINLLNDFLYVDINEKMDNKSIEIIHKGIYSKTIKQSFRLEPNIEVEKAELRDGILKIKLYKKDLGNKIKRTIQIREI
ncbi:Hsp20 family protein [Pseudomonadota bacterium]|nr:Hsp20 family protein [Pseudomonadota bacterium]